MIFLKTQSGHWRLNWKIVKWYCEFHWFEKGYLGSNAGLGNVDVRLLGLTFCVLFETFEMRFLMGVRGSRLFKTVS